MDKVYVEQDCTITHEGRGFTSGGAYVAPDYVIAYVSSDFKTLCNWHGDQTIGTITSRQSWHMPRSFMSDRMYQIYALIDGRTYTGRTCGNGYVARLRPSKRSS